MQAWSSWCSASQIVDAKQCYALHAVAATAVLFNRDGTDDAECDVSDRAKEPDEVGPETEAKDFAHFGPSK
ncbi:hypothetical protein KUIN1_33650 [Pseudomonas sp. KUIN-1]|nr:hypothetical protein KUIN1_33650 [Pseudomonas sp. KUIN-1]